MRHVLVLVMTVVWLVPGASGATAQETTPEAAAVERTNVRYFLPYTPDGLATGLTVSGDVSGSCFSESLAAVGRPDAWVCTENETGDRYDPCFENPFGPIDEAGELACVDSPFSTDIIRFSLTEPLQRQKDLPTAPQDVAPDGAPPGAPMGPMGVPGYPAPMPGDDAGSMPAVAPPLDIPVAPIEPIAIPEMVDQPVDIAEEALDPLEIPWALELSNGERCTLLTGATAVLAGQRINYGCEGGGFVLGEVDRSGPVWTVSHLGADAFASDLVAVSVVWV